MASHGTVPYDYYRESNLHRIGAWYAYRLDEMICLQVANDVINSALNSLGTIIESVTQCGLNISLQAKLVTSNGTLVTGGAPFNKTPCKASCNPDYRQLFITY